MWQYIAIGLAVAAGIIFHDFRPRGHELSRTERRGWTALYYAIFVSLILLAGLRYRIGLDTIMTQGRFYRYTLQTIVSEVYTGTLKPSRHILLVFFFKELGIPLWVWQTMCACILNIPLAIVIKRYVNRFFCATALYLVFAFIMLNFETMLEGAAAGLFIWAINDLRKWNLLSFYGKIATGCLFHLSILALAILPLFFLKGIRTKLCQLKWIVAAIAIAVAISFLVKYLILCYAGSMSYLPWLPSQRFSSSSVSGRAVEMLSPLGFNWKGYAGYMLKNIILPLTAGLTLMLHPGVIKMKGKAKEGVTSGKMNLPAPLIFGMMCFILSLVGIMSIHVNAFTRLSMYFWPPACSGFVMTFSYLRKKGTRLAMAALILTAGGVALYGYTAPVRHTGERYVAEMYVPYSSYLTRGVNYHREWLAFNYYNYDFGREQEPVYDFGFALHAGEKEIPSVIWPRVTHSSMEKERIRIQGTDSVADIIPIGTYRK